jgi:iron complex outermembrane receptor protein
MFDPRAVETKSQQLHRRPGVQRPSGLKLPGGEVGWALGAQYRSLAKPPDRAPARSTTARSSASGRRHHQRQRPGLAEPQPHPLPTTDPNFRGCTPDAPGPFVLFAPTLPAQADQSQYSLFGELQVPLFSNVDIQLAARKEKFSNDLGATVYKVSGKWNVWGPLTLRGSYGTNYQTPPLGVTPGAITVAARTYTVAASNWLAAQFITDAEPQARDRQDRATSARSGRAAASRRPQASA